MRWTNWATVATLLAGFASARASASSDPVPPLEPVDNGKAISLVAEAIRPLVREAIDGAGPNAPSLAGAILDAPEAQRGAVAFLVAHMPPRDRESLSKEYLLSNVRHAYLAREATPWAAGVPEEIFFNDVLPYASVNERRDDWRKDFYDRFLPIARESKTAAEAAQKLNVEVFRAFNVKYHATKRPKPDQSPYESADAGFASCTGLSILLIDACRAVGVPARIVGTPRWTTQPGNHNWVEIWDRQWSFVGACEPSRLNEGWFIDQASKADESKPEHRIYASAFGGGSESFPLVWKRSDRSVAAEDVTRRYTLRREVTFRLKEPGRVTVRREGRIVAQDHADGSVAFELPGDLDYLVEFRPDAAGSSPSTRQVHLTDKAGQVVEVAPPAASP